MTKEYIEREALYREVTEKYCDIVAGSYPFNIVAYDMAQLVKSAPAADVVEVVRCKDCKHFAKGMAVGMCKRIKDRPIIPTTYNHYCSYGERKEQE